MAAIPVNSRDNLLQLLVPRVLGTGTNYIFLSITTQQFIYGADGVAQPTFSLITANLVGNITGTVTFTSTGIKANSINGSAGTASTSSVIFEKPTSNSIKIYPADMSADIATISASVVYQGTTYTATAVSIQRTYANIQAKLTQPVQYYSTDYLGSNYSLLSLANQLLPANVNKLELYSGSTQFTTGLTYTPTAAAPQVLGGLKLWMTTSGEVQLQESTNGSWLQDSVNFTVSAIRNNTAYSTTFTVTKNKAGNASIQTGVISLYRWDVANPSINSHLPNGTSSYVWLTQAHTYARVTIGTNTDDWYVTPQARPNTNDSWKLYKISKNISDSTTATISNVSTPQTLTNIGWSTYSSLTEVTTTSNEIVKTGIATLYANGISTAPSVPTGSATYTWSTNTLDLTGTNTTSGGWTTAIPASAPGQGLYRITVDLLANKDDTTTKVYWDKGITQLITVYGITGNNSIGANLINSSHGIPCDYQDTAASRNFTNSGNKIFAYDGTTALTAITYTTNAASTFSNGQYVVEVDTADGVTQGAQTLVTENGVTGVSYANLTAATFSSTATGSLLFKLRGKNYAGVTFTYLVKQNFSKTPTGTPGTFTYVIASTDTIVKSTTGTYTPSTITFSGRKNTNGTVTAESVWFSIFLNGATTATANSSSAVNDYTYTIPASTTSVTVKIYSTNPASGSPVAIDTQGINVVSDGVQGTAGRVGDSARRAYTKSTGTPSSTPSIYNGSSGDALPPIGTWFSTSGVAGIGVWVTTPPTINEGEILYQSDGIYVPGGNTTWGFPYLSSLKVGNLQAITANTGELYVSGSLRGGGSSSSTNNFTSGIGYYLNSDGKVKIGNNSADYLTWDGTNLKINTKGTVTIGNSNGARLEWNGTGLNIYDATNKAILSAGTIDWSFLNNIPNSVFTAGGITWQADSSIKIISGVELQRTNSGAISWDNRAYSLEKFTGGAYISFQFTSTSDETFCGFSDTPTAAYPADYSYQRLAYGIYGNTFGQIFIYEGGLDVGINGITYNTSNVFSITYDNQSVRYFKDGVLLRNVASAGAAKIFSAYITLKTLGARLTNIRFGPNASVGLQGSNGTSGTNGKDGTNGSNGSNGTDGLSVKVVELYQLGTSAPSIAGLTAVNYNISTNVISGNGSWQLSMPTPTSASGVYMTTATASTKTPATAVVLSSWSTPILVALLGKDGKDGTNGTSGKDGSNGTGGRGSATVYAISSAAAWSDSTANTYFTTNYGAAGQILNDVMTQYNPSSTPPWATTKFWNGLTSASGSWATVTAAIDGNLLVTGTISGAKLAANTVIANNIEFSGKLKTQSATTGQRMEITNTYIKVFDAAGNIRVQIGDLTA